MDTSLLSINEHFSTSYVGVDSDGLSSPEDNNGAYSEWEGERELNGDIGLIPQSSSFLESLTDMPDITNSLPSLDYQKMPDWCSYIFGDPLPPEEISDPVPDQDICLKSEPIDDLSSFDDRDVNNFDLTTYINEQSLLESQKRKVKSKGKKIDMEACKYIIDEESDKLDTSDEIDVETVSDDTSLPVLEANDAFSLLEQFEASEQPNLHHCKSNDSFSNPFGFGDGLVNLEMQVNLIPTSPVEIFDKIPKTPVDIFEDIIKIEDVVKIETDPVNSQMIDPSENVLPVKDTKKADFRAFEEPKVKKVKSPKAEVKTKTQTKSVIEEIKIKQEINVSKPTELTIKKEVEEVVVKQEVKSPRLDEIQIKQEPNVQKPQTSESSTSQISVRNKQIRESLPQELIKRINESGKRKTITVIPPIPNTKKRGALRPLDSISQHRNKIQKTYAGKVVQLDHDYCTSTPTPYPKEPKKDSGFQSADEEDRSVLRNQPTVKTADGKVMVSLLKVNTIRNDNKKKLNIEEYRKRKCINSNATSLNSSPVSSTCSSPIPEDINLRRKLHEEKLMKMAADVLNTPPKSAQQSSNNNQVAVQVPVKVHAPRPPPGVVKKTYVSVGINTALSSINCIKSMIESHQQIEELKPLLQKASNKINSNSLLTSVLENIPKAKNKNVNYVEVGDLEVVREDVVHYFFDKNTKKAATKSVHTETDFDKREEEDSGDCIVIEGGSSPSASSSSGESDSGRRSRRCSTTSSRHSFSARSYKSPSIASPYSRSSHSSSRSRSRSPTRSISPKRSRKNSLERKNEVDERRVIYVGGIKRGTTTDDLRRRFLRFGPITNVKVHFRDHGVNYGFITFAHQEDAFKAFDYGNDNAFPKYDICFGGRRTFCRSEYSDLDNVREDDYSYYTRRMPEVVDYASLLMEHEQARHS